MSLESEAIIQSPFKGYCQVDITFSTLGLCGTYFQIRCQYGESDSLFPRIVCAKLRSAVLIYCNYTNINRVITPEKITINANIHTTRRSPNVGFMLVRRRRQRANINPKLGERFVFAGQ